VAVKRTNRPPIAPEYDEVNVCDRCGDEAYQDDRLYQFEYLGIGPLLAHQSMCLRILKETIRDHIGLVAEPNDAR
jgi:hypothetical protein